MKCPECKSLTGIHFRKCSQYLKPNVKKEKSNCICYLVGKNFCPAH